MTPIRIANSLNDYALVNQLKQALADYSNPEAVATIEITPQRLTAIYEYISNMPEGMTAVFAEQIMTTVEETVVEDVTIPAFTGLMAQIMAGVNNGDAECIQVAQAIQERRASHANVFQNHVNANLSFIANLNL